MFIGPPLKFHDERGILGAAVRSYWQDPGRNNDEPLQTMTGHPRFSSQEVKFGTFSTRAHQTSRRSRRRVIQPVPDARDALTTDARQDKPGSLQLSYQSLEFLAWLVLAS
jgi:hypothetical protein